MASDQVRENSCFQTWMNLQEHELSELRQALNTEVNNGDNEDMLRQLVEKNIKHYEEYMVKRIHLAWNDVSPYFAPTWCSSLENSQLWLGGCRPSLFFRLVHTLSGIKVESLIKKLTESDGVTGIDLDGISPNQLTMIDKLQRKTIKEEQELSEKMASLQEEIADPPIGGEGNERHIYRDPNREVEDALAEHEISMVSILEEADKLRLNTLKELIDLLTPVEAVAFMAASKQLHLCLHKWGLKRDHLHGRN